MMDPWTVGVSVPEETERSVSGLCQWTDFGARSVMRSLLKLIGLSPRPLKLLVM